MAGIVLRPPHKRSKQCVPEVFCTRVFQLVHPRKSPFPSMPHSAPGPDPAAPNPALLLSLPPAETARQIRLRSCSLVGDVGLAAIARGCPNLRHLSTGGCVRVTDASVRVLAARAGGGLKVLDFTGCRRVRRRVPHASEGRDLVWG